jgi:AAA15 family ATPase/GTPase
MLFKFEVSGFKSFNEKFSLNLNGVKEYSFNKEAVENNNVKMGIIYGVNGIGKSNLALALFDIVFHIAPDNFGKSPSLYTNNYLNLETEQQYAEFVYHFNFDGAIVIYSYKKKDLKDLISEELYIDGDKVISINEDKLLECSLNGTDTLKKNLAETNVTSAITYINNNAALDIDDDKNKAFLKFIKFVEKMLFFRSTEGNRYIGFEEEARFIAQDIIERGNLKKFEEFLNESGVECKLCEIEKEDGTKNIAFDFGKNKLAFGTGASTGTKALALFYFWMQRLNDENNGASLVFVDEFDSFYHHDLSQLIVEKLKEIKSQVLLTTHNVSVMSNDILRPDCYFVMSKKDVLPLYAKTPKELREAHNLGKMYKAGSFND